MKLSNISGLSIASILVTLTLSACADTPVSTKTAAVKTVQWNQVSDSDVGKTTRVCGPVAFAMGPGDMPPNPHLGNTLGSLIIGGEPVTNFQTIIAELNKGTDRFNVVIPIYHAGFKPNPKEYYKGKNVCVVGTVALPLTGRYEILPTHPSQIAVIGEGEATMPRGEVKSLPSGAISFEDATRHMGETKTVCGVVLTGYNTTPANFYKGEFKLPESIKKRMPEGLDLNNETRAMHELYLGDRVKFHLYIPQSITANLPKPAVEFYTDKGICATGKIKPNIMLGAYMVVESLDSIKVVE